MSAAKRQAQYRNTKKARLNFEPPGDGNGNNNNDLPALEEDKEGNNEVPF